MALVLQSILQLGEYSNDGWLRDAHWKLTDNTFTKAFIDELEQQSKAIEVNWENFWYLGVLTLCGTRLYEVCMALEAPTTEAASKFLQHARKVYQSWIRTKEVQESKCVSEIAMLYLLSFLYCPPKTPQDGLQWLEALHSTSKFPSKNKILLSLFQIMQLQIPDQFRTFSLILETDPKILQEFITTSLHCSGIIETYSVGSNKEISLRFKIDEHSPIVHVNIDCSTGDVLVDGKDPNKNLSSLQTYLEKFTDFSRLFDNLSYDLTPCEKETLLSLQVISPVSQKRYRHLSSTGNQVCIEQILDGRRLRYMPLDKLPPILPTHLATDYQHWIDYSAQALYFRPKSVCHDDFNTLEKWHYKLENQRIISRTGAYVLNSSDQTVKKIVRLFSRIEQPSGIIITSTSSNILAYIPRHKLNFEVQGTEIRSKEFLGWHLDTDQYTGTLIRWPYSLVLKNPVTQKRKVLIPFRYLDESLAKAGFRNWVGNGPSYFVYEEDPYSKCWNPPSSTCSIFYLSYLHALTSGSMRDPFTCMTGTEMALKLLLSPRCRSTEPYDDVSLSVLQKLHAVVIPTLKSYQNMLQITWPKLKTTLCTSHEIALLIHKLVQDSERLRELYSSKPEDNKIRAEVLAQLILKDSRIPLHQQEWKKYMSFKAPFPELRKLLCMYDTKTSKPVFDAVQRNENIQTITAAVLKRRRLVGDLPTFEELWAILCKKNKEQRYSSKVILRYVVTCNTLDILQHFLFFIGYFVNPDVSLDEKAMVLSFVAYSQELSSEIKLLFDVLVALCAVEPFFVPEIRSFPTVEPKWIIPTLIITPDQFQQNLEGEKKKLLAHIEELNQRSKYYWYYSNSETTNEIAQKTNELGLCEKKQGLYTQEDYVKLQQDVASWFEHARNIIIAQVHSSIETHTLLQLDLDALPEFPSSVGLVDRASKLARNMLMSYYDELLNYRHVRELCSRITSSCTPVPMIEDPVQVSIQNMNTPTLYSTSVSSFNPFLLSPTPRKDIREHLLEGSIDEHVAHTPSSVLLHELESSTKWERHVDEESTMDQLREVTNQIDQLKEMMKAQFNALDDLLTPKVFDLELLHLCQLLPPKSPSLYLSKRAYNLADPIIVESLKGVCEVVAAVKRAERCMQYLADKTFHLFRRNECLGNDWSRDAYPEWALFEIEQNMCIRDIQAELAYFVLDVSPVHQETQLTMGEGKTSVIFPISALTAADGTKLVRLIVLSSLYPTNLADLKQKLGGLLQRRVFTLPIQRITKISADTATQILAMLEECMRERGVLIMTPDSILSLQLKYYEACYKEDALASSLGAILNFLFENAFDIIDECDEILHCRNQHIYTLGVQQNPDGGSLRFRVISEVLHSIANQAEELFNTFGDQSIEFSAKNPGSFHQFRLLQHPDLEKVYQALCDKVVSDYFEGQADSLPLAHHNKATESLIKKFILSRELSEEEAIAFNSIKMDEETRFVYVMLRGLLAQRILLSSFEKRYRVDYGLDKNNAGRVMAVPFRAKDVASERRDFGQIDVAIVLTYVTYYYRGLTLVEFKSALRHLLQSKTKVAAYLEWTLNIENATLRDVRSLNIEDNTAVNTLYELLKFEMNVIDYYLQQCLLRQFCKQFPYKVSTSGWDLCDFDRPYKSRGFSGTNDTQWILPTPVKQFSLSKLQYTNIEVMANLLSPRNSSYTNLDPHITSKAIVDLLSEKSNIEVIIDSGALIVDMSNIEIAKYWLSKRRDKKACVCFNDDDRLVVVTRTHPETYLALSPFLNKMGDCLIYIDDGHTRGTDLVLPPSYSAVVTLGRGLCRDKLVQSCMRMRLLATTHSVSFWASHDVHQQIDSLNNTLDDQNMVVKILHWALNNTYQAIQTASPLWAKQGFQHLYTRDILNSVNDSIFPTSNAAKIGKLCTESDFQLVGEMYGQASAALPLLSALENWTQPLLESSVKEQVELLLDRCNSFGSITVHTSHNEEQEREVERDKEVEFESEREDHRPPKATPAQEYMCIDFDKSVVQGSLPSSSDICHISELLKKTTLWYHYQDLITSPAWDARLQCTRSYLNTVNSTPLDQYLRPTSWFALFCQKDDQSSELQIDMVLLLSPFEAHRIMQLLIEKKVQAHPNFSLHPYSPSNKPTAPVYHLPGSAIVGHWPLPSLKTDVVSQELLLTFIQLDVLECCLYLGDNSREVATKQCYLSRFLCICPKPHTEEESAVMAGDDYNLFVAECECGHHFPRSPISMLKELIRIRNLEEDFYKSHLYHICRGTFAVRRDDSMTSIHK